MKGSFNGILRGHNHVDFLRIVKFGDMLGVDLMHCLSRKTIIYKWLDQRVENAS